MRTRQTFASSSLTEWRRNRPLVSYRRRKFSFVLGIETTSGKIKRLEKINQQGKCKTKSLFTELYHCMILNHKLLQEIMLKKGQFCPNIKSNSNYDLERNQV